MKKLNRNRKGLVISLETIFFAIILIVLFILIAQNAQGAVAPSGRILQVNVQDQYNVADKVIFSMVYEADKFANYYVECGIIEQPITALSSYTVRAFESKCDGNNHWAGGFINLNKGDKVTLAGAVQGYGKSGRYRFICGSYPACFQDAYAITEQEISFVDNEISYSPFLDQLEEELHAQQQAEALVQPEQPISSILSKIEEETRSGVSEAKAITDNAPAQFIIDEVELNQNEKELIVKAKLTNPGSAPISRLIEVQQLKTGTYDFLSVVGPQSTCDASHPENTHAIVVLSPKETIDVMLKSELKRGVPVDVRLLTANGCYTEKGEAEFKIYSDMIIARNICWGCLASGVAEATGTSNILWLWFVIGGAVFITGCALFLFRNVKFVPVWLALGGVLGYLFWIVATL